MAHNLKNHIQVMEIPEREEKYPESTYKTIMAENILNPVREMNIWIHEARKIPNS